MKSDIFEDIEEQLVNALKKSAGNQDRLDNYKREKEKSERNSYKQFLKVMDSIGSLKERYDSKNMESNKDCKSLFRKIKMIERLLEQILNDVNISKIKFAPGEMINLNIDNVEILDTESDPNRPNGEIISVIRDGYMIGDVVLRHAQVVIVKN
jgi:molecular chaperone GrpE